MTISMHELNEKAVQALFRELGTAQAQRFLNQFGTGHGNYREEKDRNFDGMSVREIAEEIKSSRSA